MPFQQGNFAYLRHNWFVRESLHGVFWTSPRGRAWPRFNQRGVRVTANWPGDSHMSRRGTIPLKISKAAWMLYHEHAGIGNSLFSVRNPVPFCVINVSSVDDRTPTRLHSAGHSTGGMARW
jgi:hypothetical protein